MSKIKSFSCNQGKFFDSYLSSIDIKQLSGFNNISEKNEYQEFTDFMGDLTGLTVLDLGCGYGRYGLKLATKAKQIIGIDISKKSIELANMAARDEGISNFKGIHDDFKYPLKKPVDLVVTVNTFHHVEDLNLFIKNIKLSLKKDGRLVFFEFNPLNLLFIPFLIRAKQVSSHVNKGYFRSNIFTLKHILETNGFKITKLKKYAFLPTSLYCHSMKYKQLNDYLNRIPIINTFSAFHMTECRKIE